MTTERITIHAPIGAGFDQVLTPEALAFITELQRRFDGRRRELLQRRADRQIAIDAGQLPDFMPETASVRESEWTVAPIPADLTDRRVEITGPVDRKMVINALNSGANVLMADFEDSNSPTWSNNILGQINLRDAIAGTISYTSPEGKQYALAAKTAVLMVRPRGWHLVDLGSRERPLEQRRSSGGNGGGAAAHGLLGMSASGTPKPDAQATRRRSSSARGGGPARPRLPTNNRGTAPLQMALSSGNKSR